MRDRHWAGVVSRCASVLIALLLPLGAPAYADGIGVVLMHGKQGSPDTLIKTLGDRLESAGYLVDRPTMCWSRTRIYDRPFLACLDEIDAAMARLRARGATGFVVAGQSLGGSAALAYGARHDGLMGIIGLAPAPAPGVARRPEIAKSLAQAKEMVANGRGDQRARFSDINERPITVETSAEAFLSFLAPDGPANIVQNSAHLKAPLLWVAGDQDETQQGRDFAFAKAPSTPLNRYAAIRSTHLGTPDAGSDAVLGWLKDLTAAHQGVAR